VSGFAIKPLLTAVGWAVGIAVLVAGFGLFMSDVPHPEPVSPHGQVAAGASPHSGDAGAVQSLANDLEAKLAEESDPRLSALKARLNQNPNDMEALLSIGYLYVEKRAYVKAKGYYLRASQGAPKNLEARTHLGTVAYFLGEVDEALHHYEQVLALDADYAVALFEMGAVLRYGKGDLQGAVDTWEHFLRVDPDATEATDIRKLVDETRDLITAGEAVTPPPTSPEGAESVDPHAAPWPESS